MACLLWRELDWKVASFTNHLQSIYYLLYSIWDAWLLSLVIFAGKSNSRARVQKTLLTIGQKQEARAVYFYRYLRGNVKRLNPPIATQMRSTMYQTVLRGVELISSEATKPLFGNLAVVDIQCRLCSNNWIGILDTRLPHEIMKCPPYAIQYRHGELWRLSH